FDEDRSLDCSRSRRVDYGRVRVLHLSTLCDKSRIEIEDGPRLCSAKDGCRTLVRRRSLLIQPGRSFALRRKVGRLRLHDQLRKQTKLRLYHFFVLYSVLCDLDFERILIDWSNLYEIRRYSFNALGGSSLGFIIERATRGFEVGGHDGFGESIRQSTCG